MLLHDPARRGLRALPFAFVLFAPAFGALFVGATLACRGIATGVLAG